MRKYTAALISALAIAGTARGGEATATEATPTDVVIARMRALNDHNLDAFLSLYADNVQISVYPGQLLTSGKSELAEIFTPMIEARDVAVSVERIMAADTFVIVERTVSFGDVSEPGLALYQVQEGLITRVEFLRDSRRAKRVPRER